MLYRHYHVLDEILYCFSKDSYIEGDELWISIFEIGKIVAKRNNIKYVGRHIIEGTKKLEKEGYLNFHDIHEENTDGILEPNPSYSLTFEGYLLIKDGGYRSKMIKVASVSILNWVLTIAIAIGTVLAGLYAVTQLIDWFCEHPFRNGFLPCPFLH